MNRENPENRSRLSWWFPCIPTGILVPETIIIPYTGDDLTHLLDGQTPKGFVGLVVKITEAGNKLGWPLFLRTDYLSGKHNWKKTCYIPVPGDVPSHVARLVEESVMADIMGFPTDCWIARKLIPTKPAFHAFYGDMPIVKERRYFVQDDQVVCHHPYWPSEVFYDTKVSTQIWFDNLCYMNVEPPYEVDWLSELSRKVGKAIGGAWSIDWLQDENYKWHLIDMADAAQSYHWPGCESKII